jgi:deazaflavin-dependent oxidoreductase (nitroreductase family)
MSTASQPQDSPREFVRNHIRRYVDSGGADGYEWNGTTTLLLTTIGRRSGTARRTALIFREVDGEYVVVGSKGGAPDHPAWVLNLTANPDVRVQVKDEEFAGRARVADEAERAKLWPLMTEVWPDYDDYQKKTDRDIPVVVLEPVADEQAA